jgi:hypothetical protein
MVSARSFLCVFLLDAVTRIITSTTTTSGGRLYTHLFGPYGIDMCALDRPSTTLPLGFNLARCAVECNRWSGCEWFNFFTNQTNGVACQLFTLPPLKLDVILGCALHTVSFEATSMIYLLSNCLTNGIRRYNSVGTETLKSLSCVARRGFW